MKKVILESPFAGNVNRNIAYAKFCLKEMLMLGEAPIASHLLFTQPGILDDTKPEERKLGIEAGHAWLDAADYIAFYIDFGMSNGMKQMHDKAAAVGKTIAFRTLPEEIVDGLKLLYPD